MPRNIATTQIAQRTSASPTWICSLLFPLLSPKSDRFIIPILSISHPYFKGQPYVDLDLPLPQTLHPIQTILLFVNLEPVTGIKEEQEESSCLPFASSKGCREGFSRAPKAANLDFEARVPVPFSVFPSSYKETAPVETTTQTHEELEIHVPPKKAGRVGQYSSTSVSAQLPPRQEEEVRITREEEQYRRPGVHRHEHEYYEEHRPARPTPTPTYSTHDDSYDVVDHQHRPHHSPIDVIEREYRARAHPVYKEDIRVESTVDAAPCPPPSRHSHSRPVYQEEIRVSESTLEPHHHHHHTPTRHQDIKVVEETVEYSQTPKPAKSTTSIPLRGCCSPQHRLSLGPPNTVSIPCHHIRMGDILILQGRPCQVIRISTSGATGQHRYLGVDLFTKQLHEESSQVQHPGPSVVVQTMFGPVFKQYRVLDMQDGNIVAMTESGDVKPGLPVSEQGNLWGRLTQAFESGRGSVRVLVLTDAGRELAVDMKVIHGSRL
ncbi:woronin body major protein [Apiospora rasikravindrae]|uniref:Woronin body major protein n=1 Tax=Apiospora rasikravindrae TaxID=990691 RepID=A0ABR1S447_9PEZI